MDNIYTHIILYGIFLFVPVALVGAIIKVCIIDRGRRAKPAERLYSRPDRGEAIRDVVWTADHQIRRIAKDAEIEMEEAVGLRAAGERRLGDNLLGSWQDWG